MPKRTISDDPEPDPSDRAGGLRQRRRIRTKQMVQAEALRLFVAKGYEQTTVDDIAHAAAMSPRTFFRYFPTKEDVVLWDEYDERPFQEIWRRRFSGDPLVQLLSVVRYTMADIYRKDPDLLLTRMKLSFAVPEIRARALQQQIDATGPLFDELRKILGSQPDEMRLPVTLGAIYAAILVAMERWQRKDGREDLMQLFDEAITELGASLADLRTAVKAVLKEAAEPKRQPAAARARAKTSGSR
jgi:AcrR family transcriptional regulator